MLEKRPMKIRLYPTLAQQALMAKSFGCRRFLWNYRIAEANRLWETAGEPFPKPEKPSRDEFQDDANFKEAMDEYNRLRKERNRLVRENYVNLKLEPISLTSLKAERPWLKEVDSILLQQTERDIFTARQRFFKGISAMPKFHKRAGKQTYRTQNIGGKNIKFDYEKHEIFLPKLGWVRYADPRVKDNTWKLTSVTVSKIAGRYFASCMFTREIEPPKLVDLKTKDLKVCGLDMSLKNGFVDDKGATAPLFRRVYREGKHGESIQKRLQNRLAKADVNRQSNRHRRRILRLRKHQWRCANQRRDYIEQTTHWLANAYDVVCVESLDLRAMSQALRLGKSVMDVAWGRFVKRLGEKLFSVGKHLVFADKWFPSSKMCNSCGAINAELKLGEMEWMCRSCGEILERDPNAARNLYDFVLEKIRRFVGCTHGSAEGDGASVHKTGAVWQTRRIQQGAIFNRPAPSRCVCTH
jgi:putative transposase